MFIEIGFVPDENLHCHGYFFDKPNFANLPFDDDFIRTKLLMYNFNNLIFLKNSSRNFLGTNSNVKIELFIQFQWFYSD